MASSMLGKAEERRIVVVAGVSLAVMAVVAGWSNFGSIQAVLVEGDAAQTRENIEVSPTVFRLGILGFCLTVVLDLVVSWNLYRYFRPISELGSAVAGGFRVGYTGVLVLAIANLAGALGSASDSDALTSITRFNTIWELGLGLFGLHLVFIGWLGLRGSNVPRWVSVLVVVAGIGYIIDSVGSAFFDDYSLGVTAYTFIGEVALMGWLLYRGFRLSRS